MIPGNQIFGNQKLFSPGFLVELSGAEWSRVEQSGAVWSGVER